MQVHGLIYMVMRVNIVSAFVSNSKQLLYVQNKREKEHDSVTLHAFYINVFKWKYLEC